MLVSTHSPIRSDGRLELGKHDIGGSTKYVWELAQTLSTLESVAKVDLVTRMFYSDNTGLDDNQYKNSEDKFGEKLTVIRLYSGPGCYIEKGKLWPYIEAFTRAMVEYYQDKIST